MSSGGQASSIPPNLGILAKAPESVQRALWVGAQFRKEEDASAYLDPAQYVLNDEGMRMVSRITEERNREVAARQQCNNAHSRPVYCGSTRQFKSYNQQQKLVLTDAERAEVFDTVMSVFEYTGDRKALVLASRVIVKLFCDLFATAIDCEAKGQPVPVPHASCQILSFLFTMMRSDYVCVRKHAFDLLINIGLHASLLEHETTQVVTEEVSARSFDRALHHAHSYQAASAPAQAPSKAGSGTDVRRLPTPQQPLDSDSDTSGSGSLDSPRVGDGTSNASPRGIQAGIINPGADFEIAELYGAETTEAGDPWRVQRILTIHKQLIGVCHEILHAMVTTGEQDASVWWSALTCWTFLTSNTNTPLKPSLAKQHFPFYLWTRREMAPFCGCPLAPTQSTGLGLDVLQQVDVRAIMKWIHLPRVQRDDGLYTHLIHVLCMALFLPRGRSGHDVDLGPRICINSLNILGGLDANRGMWEILSLYTKTQSYSARVALFSVVFYYIIHLLKEEAPSYDNPNYTSWSSDVIAKAYQTLGGRDMPWHLASVFVFLPESFAKDALSFLMADDADKRDTEERKLFQSQILSILLGIRHLATEYLSVAFPLQQEMLTMMKDTEKTNVGFQLLTHLLTSPNPEDAKQGELMMFALMKSIFEADKTDASIASIMSIKQRTEKVMSETLACSPEPRVRRIFISLTEKFILLIKSKAKEHQPAHLIVHVEKLLNRHLLTLCSQAESDIDNLQAMYNLLMSHLCQVELMSNCEKCLGDGDTLTDLFLRGSVKIPAHLLIEMELDIIKHLLVAFTQWHQKLLKSNEYNPSPSMHNIRRTLLLLILEFAHHSDTAYKSLTLDYFKPFIGDPCAPIALHASSFIMHRIQSAGIAVYRKHFHKVLAWAQRENDTEVLGNTYFQCCIILDSLPAFPKIADE